MEDNVIILPRKVEETSKILEDLYPVDANYSSRCSVYQNGLKDGIITKNEFEAARNYYGRLWNYVGD